MRLIDIAPMLEYLDLKHYDKDMLVSQYSADWIYSWLESQPTIEQPQWISCAERLPEKTAKYLTWNNLESMKHTTEFIDVLYYSVIEKAWIFDGEKVHSVTHWMPLPKPPKEG